MRKEKVVWSTSPVNVPGVSYKRYNTETAFQVYCADWLRKQYAITGIKSFIRWHHSANERSSPSEGLTAKMMSQSKGMPDLLHYGLRMAIELKLPGKVPSVEQLEWLAYFRSIGWETHVITTFEHFREAVLTRIRNPPQ